MNQLQIKQQLNNMANDIVRINKAINIIESTLNDIKNQQAAQDVIIASNEARLTAGGL